MKTELGWINGVMSLPSHPKGFRRLSNRPLSGQSIVILGGGPGLTPSAARILANLPNIAVNNAYQIVPHSTCVVAVDRRWWAWHGRNVHARGDVAVTCLLERQPAPQYFTGTTLLKTREIYHPDPAYLSCINSGHAAIHLALHLGATDIYLAGFDMGFDGERTHWHEGHAIPSSLPNYQDRFRPALEKLVRLADDQIGVSIRAITPTAADIPSASFEDAITRLRNDHGYRVDNAPAPTAL